MNIRNLDQALIELAEKKSKLQACKDGDNKQSELRSELEALTHQFHYQYGSFIEEALFNIHDEFCPDNEVLSPIEYTANEYIRSAEGEYTYDVSIEEGIAVEADDFPGIKARLVLVPGPTRLILQGVKGDFKETVWQAREVLEA